MSKNTISMLLAVFLGLCSVSAAAQQKPILFQDLLNASGVLDGVPVSASAQKGFSPSFGNWFSPGSVGWGLDIQRVGNLIFVVWFTYRADGTPIWYVAVGELDGMTWTGDINVFSWNTTTFPPVSTPTNVGTMTIEWSDTESAEMSWTLNGDPGSAGIEFAAFAAGPALSNLTGHYFPFFTPGWGFTLLTQGSVTVITIYFYKNGQPTWAQGVSTVVGFAQAAELLLFNAPDLCPGCLDKTAKGGFTTQSLGFASAVYAPADGVSDVSVFVPSPSGSTDLGANPFGDIGINTFPVTATSITSAYQDNFDPDYEALLALLGGLSKKSGDKALDLCLAFDYRETTMDPDPGPTGGFNTIYAHSEPVWGGFWTFQDVNCTQPILWNVGGQMVQPWLQGSFTGEVEETVGSVQLRWVARATEVFGSGGDTCDLEQSFNVYGSKRLKVDGMTVDGLHLNGTGVLGTETLICTDGFRDSFALTYQFILPSHQQFLDDEEPWTMFRISLSF